MKSRFLAIAAVVIGISISALPTLAHHSMAMYDTSTLVTIKGTVAKIDWMNPHVWIHLNEKAEGGRIVSRRIQIAAPGGLIKRSFDKSLLNIGDTVTAEAWLPKDPKVGDWPNGRNLILADGRRFDVGDNWPRRD